MAFNSNLATFSFLIFVFGLILTYLTVDQQSKLSTLCVSKNVQTGLNVILMLSIMMTILPLVQLFCHWKCGHPQNDPSIGYKWILVGISLLLATAGGFVWSGLEDEPNCKLDSALLYMKGLVISTSLLSTFLIVYPAIPIFKGMLNERYSGGGVSKKGSFTNLYEV
jgi:hypothetical protein